MRTINIELNRTKLELKKQQLTQIETQLKSLNEKLQSVKERFDSKQAEVLKIEAALEFAAQNETVETETEVVSK